MMKNFIFKNKIAIGACVLVLAFGVGYWVLSNPGTSTIGEDITAGGRVCDGLGNCLDTISVGAFGVWNDRDKDGVADSVAFNTNYYAETDGIAMAWAWATGNWPQLFGYTDGNSNPTTLRLKCESTDTGGHGCAITMPVKKGDYWKINKSFGSYGIYWIPIGD